MSPAIDAGAPADDCSLEIKYGGNLLNLGAYGNTPVATQIWRPSATLLLLR